MVDWGEGTYERTARALEQAARRAVRAAQFRAGDRVLDLGCGTGNAALEAARLGARVVAVDPAKRLCEVTRARAAREGLAVNVAAGDAGSIPAEDGAFDVVISVFAVIFADDAEAAASSMLRVTKAGGRIVLTSWLPRGGIANAGKILREAMAARAPADVASPAPRWGDPGFVRDLFERRGAHVTIEEDALVFEAASPEAWFEEQEAEHPVWITVRRALAAQPSTWDEIRERSIACLHAANEVPVGLRATSPYLLVMITR